MEVVIDVGNYFVSSGNLADSVAPRKKLINIVAELAIYIIAQQNQKPNKSIMPLRVVVSTSCYYTKFHQTLVHSFSIH
jgi:hypothetical protein